MQRITLFIIAVITAVAGCLAHPQTPAFQPLAHSFGVRASESSQAPSMASAVQSDFTEGSFKYRILSQTEVAVAGMKGYGDTADIPSVCTHDGKTYIVVAVADSAFLSNYSVASVKIPSTVKTIGKSAFEKCYELTSVTFNKLVEEIGEQAFYNCHTLTSVKDFPKNLKRLKSLSFANCENLKDTIELPASLQKIGNNPFAGSVGVSLSLDNANPYFSLQDNIVYNKTKTQAVMGLASLKGSVELAPTVTEISPYAFYCCKEIVSVNCPDALQTIGRYAFSQSEKLSAVNLNNSLKSIGICAFLLTPSLKSIVIPDAVTDLQEGCFESSGLESVKIGSGVAEIGWMIFSGCSSLVSAELPQGLRKIGPGAFQLCTKLRDIPLPASLTCIDQHAFHGCDSLMLRELPKNLQEIGYNAFTGCNKLTELILPVSLRIMQTNGFISCQNLHLKVAEGNKYFTIRDNCLYDSQFSRLIFVPCDYSGTLSVPEGVESVVESAAYNCFEIEKINFPASLRRIDRFAFIWNLKLDNLVIPDNVDSIGRYAFHGCDSLNNVTLGTGIKWIGVVAFAMSKNCPILNFTCLAVTPPKIEDNVAFTSETLQKCILKVPEQSIGLYREAPGWNFTNIKSAAVNMVDMDNDLPTAVYRLDGSFAGRIAPSQFKEILSPGIYIAAGKKFMITH